MVHIIFQQDFSCLAVLLPARLNQYFDYRGFTFCALPSQVIHLYSFSHVADLGSSNFARHYSQNRFCFLFLRLLRYFNSPGFAYLSVYMDFSMWVLPFGFLRVYVHLQLAVAFRRRLLVPRHPLYALFSLTFKFYSSTNIFIYFSKISNLIMVELNGIEPLTSCLQNRRSPS